METFQSKGFEQRTQRIGDLEVRISSYLLANQFSAQVENEEGAVIGRGIGKTRQAAEAGALSSAVARIGLAAATESFRRSMEIKDGAR